MPTCRRHRRSAAAAGPSRRPAPSTSRHAMTTSTRVSTARSAGRGSSASVSIWVGRDGASVTPPRLPGRGRRWRRRDLGRSCVEHHAPVAQAGQPIRVVDRQLKLLQGAHHAQVFDRGELAQQAQDVLGRRWRCWPPPCGAAPRLVLWKIIPHRLSAWRLDPGNSLVRSVISRMGGGAGSSAVRTIRRAGAAPMVTGYSGRHSVRRRGREPGRKTRHYPPAGAFHPWPRRR